MLTVPPYLDLKVLDGVLSAVERALLNLGASKIWVAPERPLLTVMAELPDEVLLLPPACKDGSG